MIIVKITLFMWAVFILFKILKIQIFTPDEKVKIYLGNYADLGWKFWVLSILYLLLCIGTVISIIYFIFAIL